MAFLSCSSDFSPLFRLLDDYETHCSRSRPTPSTSSTVRRRACYTPAFDVRELNDGYYLDGELPGVDQSNIEIEFSDPHTLVIKGRTERNYQQQQQSQQTTESSSGTTSPRWRQPTVEDEGEESDSTDTDTVDSAVTSSKQKSSADQPQPTTTAHFWVAERSIGDFQRTFTFSARVDQDAVRANLKNGILSVVVPKESAPKTKKIRIQ
ncbi:30 kDa heat shock protein [Penicillium macrosclerotiorum]|uniref:30 kDa heat shock protein n=1 Tax=Penicillium macrosclerotiorum TaxID=303699 RepID=UPI0025491B20|nr:30 kDa heat shock protein [Penicillium macrosclerotiorum]KAJ5678604.1 30 kDa heat shock protein [Penicillium macrosclerotiorum]